MNDPQFSSSSSSRGPGQGDRKGRGAERASPLDWAMDGDIWPPHYCICFWKNETCLGFKIVKTALLCCFAHACCCGGGRPNQ